MKKCYIVTFELRNPGLNREKLIASIKTTQWARLGPDTFLILSFNDSAAIRDILMGFLFQGDKIYISKLDAFAAWYGLDSDVSNWIRNNQK